MEKLRRRDLGYLAFDCISMKSIEISAECFRGSRGGLRADTGNGASEVNENLSCYN
jgi:hypothetical protein